jgi:hypothetical protein
MSSKKSAQSPSDKSGSIVPAEESSVLTDAIVDNDMLISSIEETLQEIADCQNLSTTPAPDSWRALRNELMYGD